MKKNSPVRPEHAAFLRQAQGERRIEGRADLHLHTYHSDGTFSPEEVVQRAKALRLATIGITDHDTVEGIPAAQQAAGQEVEVIPGAELTVAFKDRELHILGYGLRIKDPTLVAFLSQMQAYRVDRIQAMIDRLRQHGVSVTLEEVRAIAGKGSLGRPHLAEALVKRGAVSSLEEAFQRYIGDHAPYFVKGATLTVPKAVELIRGAGGVTVLAHPHRIVEDAWLPELVAAGIQGIEVYHSDHSATVAQRYRRIAQAHHLLVTGGSDCHGFRRSRGPLIGSVNVPYEIVERLKGAMASSFHSSP